MVSIEDSRLEGGGYVLKQHVWNAARDTIQEWTGQKLVECSLYGVRIYHEGSVLATHVDRLPLGTSCGRSCSCCACFDHSQPFFVSVYFWSCCSLFILL